MFAADRLKEPERQRAIDDEAAEIEATIAAARGLIPQRDDIKERFFRCLEYLRSTDRHSALAARAKNLADALEREWVLGRPDPE